MKNFLLFTIHFLLVGGAALLIFPIHWFPSFYDVRFMGAVAIVEAGLIYGIPFVLKIKEEEKAEVKRKVVLWFQCVAAVTFLICALGDLGLYQLYKVGFEYDKLVHFVVPLCGAFVISLLLHVYFEIKLLYACVLAVVIVFMSGVLWEVFEYLADRFLKTHIYGVYGMDINRDTMLDIVYDFCGSSIGAVVAFFHFPNFHFLKK